MTWLFTTGTATVTLTSTLDGRQTACPEEVVTYTCTVLQTIFASWYGFPDILEWHYIPSSPIGQLLTIGAFQANLTNRVLDPNNPFLANYTLTLTVTATAGQNGTVIECRGDEPSRRVSLVLNVASEHSMQFVYSVCLECRYTSHTINDV